jgi:hypothetical protein
VPSSPVQPPSSPISPWVEFDHVQLAMPLGGEDLARDFWVRRLGFIEVPKPPRLAARGGCWFSAGGVSVHVGGESAFVPASKAHPALVVRGLRLLVVAAALEARWDDEIPGVLRCHVHDPFGNRIELIDSEARHG